MGARIGVPIICVLTGMSSFGPVGVVITCWEQVGTVVAGVAVVPKQPGVGSDYF